MGSCRKHQSLDRFPDTARLVDAKQSVELGKSVFMAIYGHSRRSRYSARALARVLE